MSKVIDEPAAWGTDQVYTALRVRYAAPAYAFFAEVGNATGLGKSRSADALVMSLWPSRGLHLTGIEVKASRSDWVKERDDPAKAEAICRYCDFWYVVAGKRGIIQAGELPPTWGLMEPKGGKLCVSTEAPKLDAAPMSREFLAALFRRAAETFDGHAATESEIAKARDEGWARGKATGEQWARAAAERSRESLGKLQGRLRDFEEASGLRIDHWTDGRRLAEAVKVVQSGLFDRIGDKLQHVAEEATTIRDMAIRAKTAATAITRPEPPP
jgi:hypothetical protein